MTGVEAFVALGSNLGEREELLAFAVASLRASEGIRVEALSPIYETDPVGPPPQGSYLNAVAELRTTLGKAPALPPRPRLPTPTDPPAPVVARNLVRDD